MCRARVHRSTVAGLGAVLIAFATASPAPAATPFAPPDLDTVDAGLCPFAVRAVGTDLSKPHPQNPGVIVTGPYRVALTNLATGFTRTLTSAGPFAFDPIAGTLTLSGKQLVFTAPGPPIAELDGQSVIGLDNFKLRSTTGTRSALDPCALLSPGTKPPAPRTTPAPWPAPQDPLTGMVLAGVLPLFTNLVKHEHVHLDVFVEGNPVEVPAGIGIAEPTAFEPGADVESADGITAPLHTHRPDGIIHVEAAAPPLDMTLGQVFDVWQVRLSRTCLGGYCNHAGETLRVYRNGQLVAGDPRAIPLVGGDEIALAFGPPGVPATVPSSFDWPPGIPPIVPVD